MSYLILKCLTLIIVLAHNVHAFKDNDLTAEIPPGKKECFYQTCKSGHTLEVEYQVIDGGDLDIDFRVSSPKGNPVVTEFRKSDGIHTVDPTEEGDYEICFDNSFSRITKKSVFFEIIVDGGEEDNEEGDWKKFVAPDESFGDKLSALEDKIEQIKTYNAKTIQLQGTLRAYEAKDRNIVERNFSRINFWSVVNVIVMLTVLILQVYMVRNMFNDKRKVRT